MYNVFCVLSFMFHLDVHVAVHRHKFLIIKPTRCTNFSNLFLKWNSTYFGQLFCPSSGVFHWTHSNGICHTGLLTACCQKTSIVDLVRDGILAFIANIGLPSSLKPTFLLIS